jgi:hypothetical protein
MPMGAPVESVATAVDIFDEMEPNHRPFQTKVTLYVPPQQRGRGPNGRYIPPARRCLLPESKEPPARTLPFTTPLMAKPSTCSTGPTVKDEDSPLARAIRFVKEQTSKSQPCSSASKSEDKSKEDGTVWKGKRRGGNRAPRLEPRGTSSWRNTAGKDTTVSLASNIRAG